MRISSRFEQGVYVIIILALEEGHRPVKSSTMSGLLDVSDSYLKKILMRLARSGLVNSSANKRGGYTLASSADQISLKDVFLALDEGEGFFAPSDYAERLFTDQAHVRESTDRIVRAIDEGLGDFCDRLDEVRVSDLLEDGAWQDGAIDWEARLLELEGA
jgi:Rrf2 family protein